MTFDKGGISETFNSTGANPNKPYNKNSSGELFT